MHAFHFCILLGSVFILHVKPKDLGVIEDFIITMLLFNMCYLYISDLDHCCQTLNNPNRTHSYLNDVILLTLRLVKTGSQVT